MPLVTLSCGTDRLEPVHGISVPYPRRGDLVLLHSLNLPTKGFPFISMTVVFSLYLYSSVHDFYWIHPEGEHLTPSRTLFTILDGQSFSSILPYSTSPYLTSNSVDFVTNCVFISLFVMWSELLKLMDQVRHPGSNVSQ